MHALIDCKLTPRSDKQSSIWIQIYIDNSQFLLTAYRRSFIFPFSPLGHFKIFIPWNDVYFVNSSMCGRTVLPQKTHFSANYMCLASYPQISAFTLLTYSNGARSDLAVPIKVDMNVTLCCFRCTHNFPAHTFIKWVIKRQMQGQNSLHTLLVLGT